jgi:hypothetical protein
MTRLSQALRWWRNRPCECKRTHPFELHPKVIGLVPLRHWYWLRVQRHYLETVSYSPLLYSFPGEPLVKHK